MRETAIVLGAGSSKAFNLPLGAELKAIIARDLELKFDDWGRTLKAGSPEIVQALQILVRSPEGRQGDINPHRTAAVEIADAMPLSASIDEYIERHSGDERKEICAKIAIVKAIIEAERKSTLYYDPMSARGRPLSKASDSWLALMLRDLTRGFGAKNVNEAFVNLTIVNFNYDRCVEHFIYNWLQDVYRLSQQDASVVVQSILIYHPYGRIAPLDWENHQSGMSYGASYSPEALIRMAREIRTYSEVFEQDSGLFQIRERLKFVENVVFLGFGFHQQNMNILAGGEAVIERSLRCFATKSGISDPRWAIMRERIKSSFSIKEDIFLEDYSFSGHCEPFWNEFSDVILA